MNGIHNDLSFRMKECSPCSIYFYCYGHLLNLALRDTMKEIESFPHRGTLLVTSKLFTTFWKPAPSAMPLNQKMKAINKRLSH